MSPSNRAIGRAVLLTALYASLRCWTAATPGSETGWLAAAILTAAAGMASKEVMVAASRRRAAFRADILAPLVCGGMHQSWQLYVGLCTTWGLLVVLNLGGSRSQSAGFHLGVQPRLVAHANACLAFVFEIDRVAVAARDSLRVSVSALVGRCVAVVPAGGTVGTGHASARLSPHGDRVHLGGGMWCFCRH